MFIHKIAKKNSPFLRLTLTLCVLGGALICSSSFKPAHAQDMSDLYELANQVMREAEADATPEEVAALQEAINANQESIDALQNDQPAVGGGGGPTSFSGIDDSVPTPPLTWENRPQDEIPPSPPGAGEAR